MLQLRAVDGPAAEGKASQMGLVPAPIAANDGLASGPPIGVYRAPPAVEANHCGDVFQGLRVMAIGLAGLCFPAATHWSASRPTHSSVSNKAAAPKTDRALSASTRPSATSMMRWIASWPIAISSSLQPGNRTRASGLRGRALFVRARLDRLIDHHPPQEREVFSA